MYKPRHAMAKKPFKRFSDYAIAGCIELALGALLMVIWFHV